MQPAVQSMQALVRRYYLVFMDFVIGGIIGGIRFNLEDTHITHPDRVGRLMGAMAVSFAWSYKIGDYIDEESPIKVKSHGRRLRSVFKTGFKFLINLFSNLHNRFEEFVEIVSLIFKKDKGAYKHINFKGL